MYSLKKKIVEKRVIKTDMNQLKKLFIMPNSPDKFLEFGTELLDLIHNFFQEKGGIHSEISLPELEKLFSNINIPKKPQLLIEVLAEIKKKVIAHSVKVGNPYYIGHMTSAVPYFMILLEMIIAALNQNQVKIESAKASSFVEREFIGWMHRLVFNRNTGFYKTHVQNWEVSLGNVTTDGTMANLAALLVARNKAFRPDGRFPGIRVTGLHEAFLHYGYRKGVILVSNRGHYSIEKVARIIGLGNESVIKVRVNNQNKIDINELEKICKQIGEHNLAGKDKIKILSIIGIAGTTETGNIDNLKEIQRIAQANDAHFHVDAAWGGSVLIIDSFRYLFNGIQDADSVTVDAHKLLFSPVSMGMVLFKRETDLDYLKHFSNYIIRQDSVDLGRFTIEGSRPFSALKPWATLKIFGTDGFRLLFEHAFELTSVLRGLVEMHCNFESMNQPELFIFTYRFVPKEVKDTIDVLMIKISGIDPEGLERQRLNKHCEKLRQINIVVNDLNIELHKELREDDNTFVSRTLIDVPAYFYQELVVLRAITINPLTTPEILKEIIELQNTLGKKIYKSQFENRIEKLL
jgi:putative pyridoxal-dependent aspartate 1-decarboxylase